MIREYFLSRTWPWAFGGLAATLCHCVLKAYVKYLLNDWFRDFYDSGGRAAEVGSGDADALDEERQHINHLLLRFAKIAFVLVLLNPVFKFVGNVWILKWRVALVRSYLKRWPPAEKRVENGAQRIHEDTYRMARGIQDCAMVVLDAVLTLMVFLPVLMDVGEQVRSQSMLTSASKGWLVQVVVFVAVCGAAVSVTLGWALIALEVQNQRVEADLRRKLVLHEESGSDMAPAEASGAQSSTRGDDLVASFRGVIQSLKKNYMKLYTRVAFFNIWLSSFEQAVIIMPYAITAPLLFAQGPSRISLGLVTQTAHAFSNVFDSMNILSSNWTTVTDFLSTWRRLREWESAIADRSAVAERPLMPSQATSELRDPSSAEP